VSVLLELILEVVNLAIQKNNIFARLIFLKKKQCYEYLTQPMLPDISDLTGSSSTLQQKDRSQGESNPHVR